MRVAVVGNTHLAQVVESSCRAHFDMAAPADVIWICEDTPVDARDVGDDNYVFECVQHALGDTRAVVVISSQVRVGFTARLEQMFPTFTFVCVPENIQRTSDDFHGQTRIVVGCRGELDVRVKELLSPFTDNLVVMSTESAEMSKHALNGFLALSLCYANELGELCAQVGADMNDVTAALRSDPRIGPRAYVRAGEPYTGGTLGRDVVSLASLSDMPLVAAIKRSNDRRL